MQKRLARFVLLGLLLAAGAATAYLVWNAERRIQALEERRSALDRQLDRITPAIAVIASAQEAYVDYGLKDEATFGRVGDIVDQMTTAAALIRSGDPSGEGAAHLEKFWIALSAVTSARARARELLALGEILSAADLLFSSSRPQVTALAAELRAFRAAELDGLRIERAAVMERAGLTLAALALFWIGGLFALVRVPASPPQPLVVQESPPVQPVVDEPSVAEPSVAEPSVDLAAVADLCVQIVRLTDTASLPVVLERAAGLLDARGMVIWMGAGDELFAATAFGYDPAVVARLPPIHRSADNATAMAWRTGELRTVGGDDSSPEGTASSGSGRPEGTASSGSGRPEGTASSRSGRLGAVVAPMFGAVECIGVLAAEVRNGREKDAATRAVTAILASQLAGVLAAWPAAAAGKPSGSDRQTAAS